MNFTNIAGHSVKGLAVNSISLAYFQKAAELEKSR